MKNVNDSTVTRVVCAILFLCFTFVFLYCYEGDMLVIGQHMASGGKTHYEYVIGAVLLTFFLFFVQMSATALTRLRGIFHAVTYFPSLLILTFLTHTPTEQATLHGTGAWVWQLPLMLLLWLVAAWLARRYQSVEGATRGSGLFSQLTFINVLTLTAFMLVPCLLANQDRTFHKHIRQEYLITRGHYDEALTMGQRFEQQDARQAMVNAYCLFKKNTLADSLFSLTLPHNMTCLYPTDANGHFLLMADSVVVYETEHHRDALLCKRLLSRQLPEFASRLQKWYKPTEPLPRHYREALALCREHNPAITDTYPAEMTDTVLLDFQRLRHADEQDSLRGKYGDTYWYYYYRSK